MGVNEGEGLGLHLPAHHFVCWPVLVRTIRFYVWASSVSPLSKDAALSQTVYRLLHAIYHGEAMVSADPSNEAIAKVVEMLVDEQGETETEMMHDALRLVFPEFMAAEAKQPVILLDPHPDLTIAV